MVKYHIRVSSFLSDLLKFLWFFNLDFISQMEKCLKMLLFAGMHGREVIEQVERGYRMPKPTCHFIPDAIYRLMLQCWDADPDKRPTFEFLNHYLEDFTVTSELPYREVID